MNACTIVARNYLGQAAVLAESFLEHHPGGSFTTLVIDAERGLPDGVDPRVGPVGPEATGLAPEEFHRMAAAYSVVELATAVKPFLLRTMLAGGMDQVTYLDPDIQVFAPLDDIAALATAHDIVLTPHLEHPLPPDRALTDIEAVLLDAGIFNLGFIAVGAGGTPFLDWWGGRLARDCVIDPQGGMFVDQRWVNLVPGYFTHHVLIDPTINVAWWNLPVRDLQATPEGYTVEGRPLRFFHFSGYDPSRPHLLSSHSGPAPRVLLSDRPGLRRICDEYGARLLAAGHGRLTAQPYGLATTPGGLPIDGRMRRMYREALLQAEHHGESEPPNPFAPDGGAAFVDWLREPMVPPGAPAPVSRYLRRVYVEHPELPARYPDIDDADGLAFIEWCAGPGRDEEGIAPELVPGPSPAASRAVPALLPGIQVSGYFTAEAGVGEAARRVLAAVAHAGLPHSVLTYDRTPSRRGHALTGVSGDDHAYDINLMCVNADQLPSFNHDMGAPFRQGRYAVGLWWWEVDRFPERYRPALDLVDEVWVGSDYVRESIARTTDTPVLTLPIPVTAPVPSPGTRARLGLDGGFLFYFSFDFDSVVTRKNPAAVVQAFRAAFAPGEGPRLLIRSINGDRHLPELERLRYAASDRADITVLDGYLDAGAKDGLMCECDCYVSLHRSEGLGLTMAEAMAAGRPVIATGHSGNLEFMDAGNSLLVPVRELRPVGGDSPPYPADALWAEPDLDAAARLMREALERPDEMARLGERARADVLARFSLERAGAFIAEQVARIHREGMGGRARSAVPGPPTARTARWISEGPSIPWDAPASRLQVLARRGLLRAMAPYLRRRAEFDVALVQSDEEAGLRLDRLGARMEHVEQHLATAEARADRAESELATLRAIPYMSDPRILATVTEDGRPAIGFRRRDLGGRGYRGFEDVFRGPEDFIRERQRVYLRHLGGRAPVLDLGCGRGEFLDLLSEAGVAAAGIDLDEGMVARCREKGHAVERADAIEWLAAQPAGSLGAIFSAQVIEHLPHAELTRLLDLAARVLEPGGVLIAETVNPHPIASFKAFWVDLTHTSPIFPEVAVALCGLAGFQSAEVVFPVGTGSLEEDRWVQGEYAVVARTATATELGESGVRGRS